MEIAYLAPDFQDGSESFYGRLFLVLVVAMKLLLYGADCVVCTTKEKPAYTHIPEDPIHGLVSLS